MRSPALGLDMLVIRDGTHADLEALVALRQTHILFEQYIIDAQTRLSRFMVCVRDDVLVGFAELVFEVRGRKNTPIALPRFNDLFVAPQMRSQGIGTSLIAAMEAASREHGFGQLYCSVDPVTNHRALALYRRLGYEPLDAVPERKQTVFFDAWGEVQQHVYWRQELVKVLG
jgi:GNAT superfamily N-acetyltransferase